ncbi:AAA family ATPase [Streptomyces kutzneri]|uniref:AAA family ATPase n=1 Tax=Streptomyces kutzneri TaxID=3051179 RepID=UPI003F9AD9BD
MVGLPGSGKTTPSRALTNRGFVRLCPDEEMFRRHGVLGWTSRGASFRPWSALSSKTWE